MRREIAATLIAIGAIGGQACDNSATFFEQQLRVREVRVLGAQPARTGPTLPWASQCGPAAANADGLQIAVAVASHQRDDGDLDEAVGPGDRIRHRDVLPIEGPDPGEFTIAMDEALGLRLDCVGAAGDPSCTGSDPAATQVGVEWISNGVERGQGSDMVLVLDYSGSTSGLVDAESGREMSPNGLSDYVSDSFIDLASDFSGLRRASLSLFLGRLNPKEDRFAVVAFGEGLAPHGLLVPCRLSTGADPMVDLAACFHADREVWDGQDGIAQLGQHKTPGRANLWEAVEMAGDLLAGLEDRSPSSHVIVVSDGPDTCEGTGVCGHDATLEGALLSLQATGTKLHSVQMESLGYPGRDAEQLQATCQTGGHYRYINSNHLSDSGSLGLREALDAAMLDVRLALRGHWQISLEIPALAALPVDASAWALDGGIVGTAASGLVDADTTWDFGWGDLIPGAWDGRPSWLSGW